MGLFTLEDFHDELAVMMDESAPRTKPSSRRMTRYVNMGYNELTSTQEFKALFAIQTIPTVVDDRDYTINTDIQSVRGVIDTTNKYRLLRISTENYFLLDPDVTGQPTRWTRENGLLWVHPVPDAVYSLDVLHQQEPTPLAVATDVTVLRNVWDQAVLLLAAKAAATSQGDTEKVELFLGLARNYIGSRMGDQGADGNSPSVGTDVAWDEGDLTELR